MPRAAIRLIQNRCGEGKFLHIHHISHDRSDNTLDNLITLCRHCHPQTNFGNREEWQALFRGLLALGEEAA